MRDDSTFMLDSIPTEVTCDSQTLFQFSSSQCDNGQAHLKTIELRYSRVQSSRRKPPISDLGLQLADHLLLRPHLGEQRAEHGAHRLRVRVGRRRGL